MSWQQNLRPASLGNARFHVAERAAKGGKRIKNHEYPKRDQNFPEEMGLKTRRWSVDAYVIGDDYMSQRDSLVKACERKGTQSYSDFWGRSGVVQVESWEVKETNAEGRWCRISLELINAGIGSAMPAGIPATGAMLSTAATGLRVSALAGFASSFTGPASSLSGAARLGNQVTAGLASAGIVAGPASLARGLVSGLASLAANPLGALRAGVARGQSTAVIVGQIAGRLAASFAYRGGLR